MCIVFGDGFVCVACNAFHDYACYFAGVHCGDECVACGVGCVGYAEVFHVFCPVEVKGVIGDGFVMFHY